MQKLCKPLRRIASGHPASPKVLDGLCLRERAGWLRWLIKGTRGFCQRLRLDRFLKASYTLLLPSIAEKSNEQETYASWSKGPVMVIHLVGRSMAHMENSPSQCRRIARHGDILDRCQKARHAFSWYLKQGQEPPLPSPPRPGLPFAHADLPSQEGAKDQLWVHGCLGSDSRSHRPRKHPATNNSHRQPMTGSVGESACFRYAREHTRLLVPIYIYMHICEYACIYIYRYI